jgi:hypothetical protein
MVIMNNNFGHGKYLTPQNRPNNKLSPSNAISHSSISGGLVYDNNYDVIPQSVDPRFKTISIDLSFPTIDHRDEEYMYLGYYFRHYGHFILETLPMLSYCIDHDYDQYKKIFLPFFLNANNIQNNITKNSNYYLLQQYLNLLDLSPSQINLHQEYAILQSNLTVPDKICKGNKDYIDILAYQKVINKIKTNKIIVNNPTRKLFLVRKLDNIRISSCVGEAIHKYCESIGFEMIDMTKFSLYDQIVLMSNAKVSIGFSGSQMHNSMFMSQESKCIVLCDWRDFRSPKSYIPNQKLCNNIAGCESIFIDFKCEKNMRKNNHKDTNFKNLDSNQEAYIINHYIDSIKTLNL